MILYNPTPSRHRDRQPLPAGHPPRGPERRAARLPRGALRRHRVVGGGGDDPARATSWPGSARADPTALPQARRRRTGVQVLAGQHADLDRPGDRPDRSAVPGDRRHLDVQPAQRRHLGTGQGGAPDLDAGPDQVGPDDLSVQDVINADGSARPGRGTAAPARSAPTGPSHPTVTFDVRRRGLRRRWHRPAAPGRPQRAQHQRRPAARLDADHADREERLGPDPDVQDARHGGRRSCRSRVIPRTFTLAPGASRS